MRIAFVSFACAVLCLSGGSGALCAGAADKGTEGQDVKTVVPGRMVCCQECKAKQDVPGGIGHCSDCGAGTNIANKFCTKCAKAKGVCEVCGKSMAAAAQPAEGGVQSVVPGRMVCGDKCKARLDLANGVKKCPDCGEMCNVAHALCTKCARKKGVCEVCGKAMAAGAVPDPKAAPGDFKRPPADMPGAGDAAKVDVARLVAANTEFAQKLYDRLRWEKGNLAVSPYSISTALAMTYAGAGGETKQCMMQLLGFHGEVVVHEAPREGVPTPYVATPVPWPDAALHAAFGQLQGRVKADPKAAGCELSVANALWGQKDYKFLDAFLQTCNANYGGGLKTVDFVGATEAARTTINTWVEQQTRDKIKELLKPGVLDANTRLVLTNAIYFKGQWETAFDKKETKDAPFTLAVPASSQEEAPKVNVPLMHRKGKYTFWETDGLQVLEMPYKGGEVSMVIILPTMPQNLDAVPRHAWRLEEYEKLERVIGQGVLGTWLKNMKPQEVDVYLPRFTVTKEFSLAETLKSMGMTEAFVLGKADFSGMTGTKDLFISAIIHKAFVDVNEEGTEAAAATGVVMETTAMPEQPPQPIVFRADHPFIFLIRDNRSGSILFLGRVMNPAE